MTVPALWTKHRPLARRISREFRIPGNEPQDTEQEALIGLWEAARGYDKGKGATFPTYAALVVRRHLTDCLRTATRDKRHAVMVELEDAAAPDGSEGQMRLQDLVAVLPSLTDRERRAVAAQLDGSYSSKDRSVENALQSARRKLRAA